MVIDQHFTPDWLADLVAASLPATLRGTAVDPAAGTGALLASLDRNGLGHLRPVALDIDPLVVSHLRNAYPRWTVSTADFLSPRSRASSRAIREVNGSDVTVVLLNPPFSYRGGPAANVTFGNFVGRLSPAARFVATSIESLRPTYGLVAILPDGVLNGEKYAAFWREVERTHRVRIIQRLTNGSFAGVRARCSVVEILTKPLGTEIGSRRVDQPHNGEERSASGSVASRCRCVEVIRGRVPRHRHFSPEADSVDYLHTTSIRSNAVVASPDRAPRRLATRGPFVLIPRVGFPSGKIAASGSESVVLSDCLIALRPLQATPGELATELSDNLAQLKQQYTGTGAAYVTVERVVRFMRMLGWHATTAPASGTPGACSCESAASSLSQRDVLIAR